MHQEQVRFELGKLMYHYRMSDKDASELVSVRLMKGKDYVYGFTQPTACEALGEIYAATVDLLSKTYAEKVDILVNHISVINGIDRTIVLEELEARIFPSEPEKPEGGYMPLLVEGTLDLTDADERNILHYIRDYRESLSARETEV